VILFKQRSSIFVGTTINWDKNIYTIDILVYNISMNQFLVIALFVFMIATFAVMMTGIILMAKGGEANKKYGNRLMQLRVIFQGVALMCLAILISIKD
jgi:hypothetical protein